MAKSNWYAWRDAEGNAGVCQTWEECLLSSKGRRGEKHQGFRTREKAWAFAYPEQREGHEQLATEEKKEAPQLDASKIEKPPVSEKVCLFCDRYGFSRLSEDQRRAVQAERGKYLLFAVPGSGKTTVLMARTGYLIHACGVPPASLMTMTFTRASAREMKERYCRYFDPDEKEVPDFRTIHSFCWSVVIPLLRRAGLVCPSHVIDEHHKERAVRQKYSSHTIFTKLLQKYISKAAATDETAQESAQTALSGIKNRRLAEGDYASFSLTVEQKKIPLVSLLRDYQEILRELDCMDFDDMLIFALEGLNRCPDVLRKLRETYRYWSIDEAQDNSRVQHDLMLLLSGPDGNMFMVGDDDQSIYGFRGAEPGMLLEFGARPDVHLLVMGTNYRSGSVLVDTARAFVEENRCRADKSMNADRKNAGLIRVPLSFRTEAGQYEYINSAIQECAKKKQSLGILYQLNLSSLPILVHLHRLGVEFEASKGLSELLGRKMPGIMMKLLRFSQHPGDFECFSDCRKSLGLFFLEKDALQRLRNLHAGSRGKPILKLLLDSFEEENERSRRTARLLALMEGIREATPSDAVRMLFQSPDLAPSSESLTDRLAQYALLSICDLYETIPELLKDLAEMERAEKQTEQEREGESAGEERPVASGETPKVSLTTIHSAKGREWDRVILLDVFQETFPGEPQEYRLGYDPEEARRLFYVAVTRAKQSLDILTVGLWHGNCETVSDFVGEYAFLADQTASEPVTEQAETPEQTVTGTEYLFTPSTFYGVPFGRAPGVYTDYARVQEQIHGFPVPRGREMRKFFSYEEAWAYTFPGVPLPPPVKPLSCRTIRELVSPSGGAAFNRAVDLPAAVTAAVLEHLNVPSLSAMTPARLAELRGESDFFGGRAQVSYRGRTDGYAVAYLPVNVHKVWLPLWRLLSEGCLPGEASVLELGPGPGSAAWGLLEFYRLLALANPERRFSLRYTAFEREEDFRPLFERIRNRMLAALPHNLSVRMDPVIREDAFRGLTVRSRPDLDLVLESNMLNQAENAADDMVPAFLDGVRRNLKLGGCAILIEPGTTDCQKFLNRVAGAGRQVGLTPTAAAAKTSVFLAGNTLVKQAREAKLRSGKMEHWFSVLTLRREGESA